MGLQAEWPVWKRGNLRISGKHGIVEHLAEISAAYGTTITVSGDGCGVVQL